MFNVRVPVKELFLFPDTTVIEEHTSEYTQILHDHVCG